MNEAFSRLYGRGKAGIGFREKQIADAIGKTPPALLQKRKDPYKRFGLGEVVTLSNLMGWTDEEILSLFHASKK